MEVILNYMWDVRFILLFIVSAILLLIFLGWQKAEILLYQLMLQAKSMAKDAILKSGKQQEDWVVNRTLQFLPSSLKVFFSEDIIRKILKWLYKQAKDYADDGSINNSI